MTDQLKEKNLSAAINIDLLNPKKFKPKRPNIDHLIKRIMVEKRKEARKNKLIFLALFVVAGGIMILSLSN